jgi:DNA-binding FadR family transcriptional regulator
MIAQAEVTKIQRPTALSDTIANWLIRYIAESNLRAGDQLPSERELVEMAGVSRLPLREALCKLKGLGLVEAHHGKGFFVRRLDLVSIFSMLSPLLRASADIEPRHVQEARLHLEPHIAARAARFRKEEDIRILRDCVARMEASVEDKDAFVEADMAFHQQLAFAADNPVFNVFMVALTDLLREVQFLFPDRRDYRAQSLKYHQMVLAAVEAGDEGAAEQALWSHLRNVQERI